MRFGKTTEGDTEQIRCEGCNGNMLKTVHDEPVINFIGKDDQLMLSGEIDNLLQYLFRIECTGRVIRIDDNNRFCAVGDLLSHIINVWIPFGLFIADVVDGFSTGQRCAGGPERVIRGWDEDFITVIQKSGHAEVDQLTDAVSGVDIIDRNIWQFL